MNYLSSEVETHVAVNPTNANNVAGYSFDGGLTWARSWPAFTRCAGGTGNTGGYERGTDPWVSFSPNARLHTMALVTWVGANDGNLANRTDVFHRPGG